MIKQSDKLEILATNKLDDPIDADRLDPLVIEELAGSIEQSLACRRSLTTSFLDHYVDSITERSV